MNGTTRHRRNWTAITITVAVIAVILTWPAQATASRGSSISMHPSSVQGDYDAAWDRLETYLNGLQAIDGQVSSADIAPVVASLNLALDRLNQAKIAMSKGQLAQATANITQANAIMDTVDSAYQALQAQAQHVRLMNIAEWIGGITIACIAFIVLLLIKKSRDKKKLREFLDAEIDYSGVESKPDSE